MGSSTSKKKDEVKESTPEDKISLKLAQQIGRCQEGVKRLEPHMVRSIVETFVESYPVLSVEKIIKTLTPPATWKDKSGRLDEGKGSESYKFGDLSRWLFSRKESERKKLKEILGLLDKYKSALEGLSKPYIENAVLRYSQDANRRKSVWTRKNISDAVNLFLSYRTAQEKLQEGLTNSVKIILSVEDSKQITEILRRVNLAAGLQMTEGHIASLSAKIVHIRGDLNKMSATKADTVLPFNAEEYHPENATYFLTVLSNQLREKRRLVEGWNPSWKRISPTTRGPSGGVVCQVSHEC